MASRKSCIVLTVVSQSDTAIGNTCKKVFKLAQISGQILTTAFEMTFHHHPNNRAIAVFDGCSAIFWITIGLQVRSLFERHGFESTWFCLETLPLAKFIFCFGNGSGIIVGFAITATKHHMTVWITFDWMSDTRPSADRPKKLWLNLTRLHGIDSHCHTAVSVPVLKPTGQDRPSIISRWVWLSQWYVCANRWPTD